MNILKLSNANLYINGTNLAGKVAEVSYDDIVAKMIDHAPVSQHGSMQLPVGTDKVNAKISWDAFYADCLNFFSNIYVFPQMQIRGDLKSYNSGGVNAEYPVVIFMQGPPMTALPGGDFKQHENVELETGFNCHYFKLQINGALIIEIDVPNNVYNTATGDVLANYRSVLGI